MNRSELALKISVSQGLSHAHAIRIVDEITGEIISAMKRGEKVLLLGFGNFEKKTVAARSGRHPITGLKLIIPARNKCVFTEGDALKTSIN